MRQVLTLVAIKNILVRSPIDVTNKHGWTSAIISAVRHHLRTLCYIERLRQGVYRKVARRINGKKKSSVIAQDSVILSQDTPRDGSLRSA